MSLTIDQLHELKRQADQELHQFIRKLEDKTQTKVTIEKNQKGEMGVMFEGICIRIKTFL